MALTPAEQAMWANARQRGLAMIGCGLLCGAVTLLAIKVLKDTFYVLPVLMGPPVTLFGLVLVIAGNRTRPPQWAPRAVLASLAIGVLLGGVGVAYLRGGL